MDFGRVDVYWPDGPIESYRLNKPTVAVGRSSGNDIVLDTTAISRYHITFTYKNQQVLLEDLQSVNGTYVDGVRLSPHDPYSLRGGEEIQIGDMRLIFHPATELAGLPGDTTQRITLTQPTYRIELEGPEMAVAPGAHVQATLRIENLSSDTDHYYVEVEGLPQGWVRVDRPELEIDSGQREQVLLSFKPLRRSESQPGDYPFVVRVRSKSQAMQTIDAPTLLRVLPYSGFGIALGTSRIEDHDSFKLYIHNQGNAPLPLLLQGTDPGRALHYHFPAAAIALQPGEHQTVIGTISPRRRSLLGQAREHEFALAARARDASGFIASVPGTYVVRPALPGWAPALVLPALALFGLLVAGTIFLLLRGTRGQEPVVPPTISAFNVQTPSIALSDTAQLAWSVTDADTVELIVESGGVQQTYPVEPQAAAYPLTFDQTGKYTVVLEASHGPAVKTALAEIEVRPAVSLSLEVLDVPQLVRYVQQDVRIRWNVSGAAEVNGDYNIWVQGSGASNAPLIAAPLALSGYRDIQVIPGDEQVEWLVTLYAQGRDGVVASVTQKLPVAYPSCQLVATRTIVRSGPGENYPALVPPLVNQADEKTSLSPTGRDLGGDWLQVSIGVDNPRAGWVRRDDFSCENFDPLKLRVITDVPAPPATPLPTAATAAPTVPAASATPPAPGPTPTGRALPTPAR